MSHFLPVFILILSALLTFVAPAPAQEVKEAESAATEENKPTVSISTDFLSQYVSRGIALSSGSMVVQPSLTGSWKGLSLNIWGNFDTHQVNKTAELSRTAMWNETDVTLSYTLELTKEFSVIAGDVHYFYPNAPFDGNEVFAGGTYTFPWFSVALTGYREVSHYPGWWVQLDFLTSLPLHYHDMSLDLGASFGYQVFEDKDTSLSLDGREGSYADFHSGTLQAGLKIPVCKWLAVTPKVWVAFPLTSAAAHCIEANSWDAQAVHVFGGLNVTATF